MVEGPGGREFLAEMKAEVFDPLGMGNTLADQYDSIIPNRTGFYHRTAAGTVINGPAVDNSDVWAGGGFLSTAEDLVRFAHGVVAGPLLSDRGATCCSARCEPRTERRPGTASGGRSILSMAGRG